jgi:glucose-1-phosphate thymidylyltransferase
MENSRRSKYVALVPAAGVGSRLPERRLSKELLPFGDAQSAGSPAVSILLNSFIAAGIEDLIIVIRLGKQDIQEYLSGSEWENCRFSYNWTPGTSGVPETVALGLQDAGSRNVVFGFPDILFEPRVAFRALIDRLESTDADVVLGLFPTDNPGKMDMVATGEDGRVLGIEIKPEHTTLTLAWILAAWKPSFSHYLSDLVYKGKARLDALAACPGGGHLGHAFQLAMADGMKIESESFPAGRSLDIGTPEDLARASTWTG